MLLLLEVNIPRMHLVLSTNKSALCTQMLFTSMHIACAFTSVESVFVNAFCEHAKFNKSIQGSDTFIRITTHVCTCMQSCNSMFIMIALETVCCKDHLHSHATL